jgi:ribosomal RNA assembly protein
MQEVVRIPEERKAVLIGRDGAVKREIEEKTGTRLRIADDVAIDGDALDVLKAAEVVKAVGRGFSPQNALLLLKEEYELLVISLPGRDKPLRRLLARLIGTHGRTRRNIEEMSGAHVAVYGKTISMIGTYGQVSLAGQAVELLLSGKSHSYVYGRMKRAKRLSAGIPSR